MVRADHQKAAPPADRLLMMSVRFCRGSALARPSLADGLPCRRCRIRHSGQRWLLGELVDSAQHHQTAQEQSRAKPWPLTQPCKAHDLAGFARLGDEKDWQTSRIRNGAGLGKAMRVFRQKGRVGTTFADLTEAARIKAPSLCRGFGSKEGLFFPGPGALRRRLCKRPRLRHGGADCSSSGRGALERNSES